MTTTVDIDLFAGHPVPAADPLRVLVRILSAGCVVDLGNGRPWCYYCAGDISHADNAPATLARHAPGCPYVEAVTLFGDPNATDAPRGVLNP